MIEKTDKKIEDTAQKLIDLNNDGDEWNTKDIIKVITQHEQEVRTQTLKGVNDYLVSRGLLKVEQVDELLNALSNQNIWPKNITIA